MSRRGLFSRVWTQDRIGSATSSLHTLKWRAALEGAFGEALKLATLHWLLLTDPAALSVGVARLSQRFQYAAGSRREQKITAQMGYLRNCAGGD